MRKFVGIFLSMLLACTMISSCARKPKVIPVKEMKEIYQEMLIADQWVNDFPEKRAVADTTWFYRPILEKHGYTMDDYYKTVSSYLKDPERYAELMKSVGSDLSAESDRLQAEWNVEQDLNSKSELDEVNFSLLRDVLNNIFVNNGTRMVRCSDGEWHPISMLDASRLQGGSLYVSSDGKAEELKKANLK